MSTAPKAVISIKRRGSNDILGIAESDKLAQLLASIPKGTNVDIFLRQPDLKDQYVGNYEVGALVPPVVTPPPVVEQPPVVTDPPVVNPPVNAKLIWSSNLHGKWDDGQKITITKKQGGQVADDKSIFVAASGSPKLVRDGNGVAHLVSGSGGVANISFKGLCMHQGNISPLKANADGIPCEQRGGGEGWSLEHRGWDSKRESCHNNHNSIGSGSLPKAIEDLRWHIAKFSWKHEGSGIRLIGMLDYLDGQGFRPIMNKLDANPNPWFMQKPINSTFWIRLNNNDHGRIYVMAWNYDAELICPFMFEPAKNSIALKNVELYAI